MSPEPPVPVAILLGHPVAHSKSPQVMAAISSISGLSLRYDLRDIPPGNLAETLREITAAPELVGLNFTLPHKELAYSLADSADESASVVGAANVWAKSSAGFRAHNTDGQGLVWALTSQGILLEDADVLLVGAGGAARGISRALLQAKAHRLWIWNRTLARAESLAQIDPQRIFVLRNPEELTRRGSRPLLMIHTTSLGLKEGDHPRLLSLLSPLRPYLDGTTAADIVYRSETKGTAFLELARTWGIQSQATGYAMLICQAVLAFNLWLGSTLSPGDVLPEILRRIR